MYSINKHNTTRVYKGFQEKIEIYNVYRYGTLIKTHISMGHDNNKVVFVVPTFLLDGTSTQEVFFCDNESGIKSKWIYKFIKSGKYKLITLK